MNPEEQPASKAQFIIEYDPSTGGMRNHISGSIPMAQLVNALEVAVFRLKLQQVQQIEREAQQKASVSRIIPANAAAIPRFPS